MQYAKKDLFAQDGDRRFQVGFKGQPVAPGYLKYCADEDLSSEPVKVDAADQVAGDAPADLPEAEAETSEEEGQPTPKRRRRAPAK